MVDFLLIYRDISGFETKIKVERFLFVDFIFQCVDD